MVSHSNLFFFGTMLSQLTVPHLNDKDQVAVCNYTAGIHILYLIHSAVTIKENQSKHGDKR